MNKMHTDTSRSFWSAFLIGVGLMAGIDTIIFHQVLQWHHFYDRSTPEWGLLSDGFLHAAELLAIVAGIFMLVEVKRNKVLDLQWAWAGLFIGLGGFQLFDGIIDHKLLRVHQIRYGVDNIFIYDLFWNLSALMLLLVGFWLYNRAKKANSSSNTAH